ncbi:hypothetical protein QBC32DRAFT_314515 [Pseudoneurospora amorphoporcata]|uniref:Uncharacterized protein n=1 Tax=Pseudoneurospora amorphoporcata TaxID=241081 RepID=A0AAN6SF01_9PEZI|nr:hypothetical protein QBC32DRAFT_314515 [Pseudoneurospora amorphoporcata]
MCIVFHIRFSGCAHLDGLFVPCADRHPNTRDCPHGAPREVRYVQDRPCDDCIDDDLAAAVEVEQEHQQEQQQEQKQEWEEKKKREMEEKK